MDNERVAAFEPVPAVSVPLKVISPDVLLISRGSAAEPDNTSTLPP